VITSLSHKKVRTVPVCARHAIAEVTYLEYGNDISEWHNSWTNVSIPEDRVCAQVPNSLCVTRSGEGMNADDPI
jgi:hypothetical protein